MDERNAPEYGAYPAGTGKGTKGQTLTARTFSSIGRNSGGSEKGIGNGEPAKAGPGTG